MEVVLAKIRALHKTNEEIVARVEQLTHVEYYDYLVQPIQPHIAEQLVLEEVRSTTNVADVLDEYRFDGKLHTDVWDLFGDKPDLSATTWKDLKRLNKELLAIVDKFALLKEAEKVTEELTKYLHNFEIIQTGLGQVEEMTMSQESRKRELVPSVAEINLFLGQLKAKGVIFGSGTFRGGSILTPGQVSKLTEWYGHGWTMLIHKASRDGWSASDFHSRCDGKGETVTVVRSTNGSFFGGYLGQSWRSNDESISCDKASLFTLVNPHGIAPVRLNVSSPIAAYGYKDRGPTFGDYGHDLLIVSNANQKKSSCSDFPYHYRDTTGKGNTLFTGSRGFQVAEIEVYAKP